MMMEPSDPIFNLFHRYSKLVRRGLTKPLTHHCGFPYVTALGEKDNLVLRCDVCGTITEPGLGTISDVEAVVKEHFVDD